MPRKAMCVLVVASLSILATAQDNSPKQALYAVMGSLGPRTGHRAAIRVCAYEVVPDERGDPGLGRKTVVHDLPSTSFDLVKVFDEARTVVIGGTFEGDQAGLDFQSLRVLRMDEPGQLRAYVPEEPLILHPLVRFYTLENVPFVAVHAKRDPTGKLGEFLYLNLDTMTACPAPVTDFWKYEDCDRGAVVGERRSPVLTEKQYEGFLGGASVPEGLHMEPGRRYSRMLYNSPAHLLFEGDEVETPYMGASLESKLPEVPLWGRRVLHFDKDGKEWGQIDLKGDASVTRVVGPWLTWKVGWDYPEARLYGPVFTGEYSIIHIETGKTADLYLGECSRERDAEVLLGTEDTLIVKRGQELVLHRVRHGIPGMGFEIRPEEGTVLLRDDEVPRIQALFWGPPVYGGNAAAADSGSIDPVEALRGLMRSGKPVDCVQLNRALREFEDQQEDGIRFFDELLDVCGGICSDVQDRAVSCEPCAKAIRDCEQSPAIHFITWLADFVRNEPPSEERMAVQARLLSFVNDEFSYMEPRPNGLCILALLRRTLFHDKGILVVPAFPAQDIAAYVAAYARSEDPEVSERAQGFLADIGATYVDDIEKVIEAASPYLAEVELQGLRERVSMVGWRWPDARVSESQYFEMCSAAPDVLTEQLICDDPVLARVAADVLRQRADEGAVYDALARLVENDAWPPDVFHLLSALLCGPISEDDMEEKRQLLMTTVSQMEKAFDRAEKGSFYPAFQVPLLTKTLTGSLMNRDRREWHLLAPPYGKDRVIHALLVALDSDMPQLQEQAASALGDIAWFDADSAAIFRKAMEDALLKLARDMDKDPGFANTPDGAKMLALRMSLELAIKKCEEAEVCLGDHSE